MLDVIILTLQMKKIESMVLFKGKRSKITRN